MRKLTTELSNYLAEIGRAGGRKGGKTRAQRMSKRQRSRAAQKAARARWDKHKKETTTDARG